MTVKKLFEEGLTKDQLFDIMSQLPEETLADLAWCAEVELMDRAYVANETAGAKDQCFAYSGA